MTRTNLVIGQLAAATTVKALVRLQRQGDGGAMAGKFQ